MGAWSRIRKTFHGNRHSAEIQEELEFHLATEAAGGRTAREARLHLGNLTRIEEETRAMGIVEWLDSAPQDARFGLRQLRKTPALALAAVLSLAIGIGANTAIFSLVDAALLKPLPVKDPDALRVVEWTSSGFPEGVENINGEYGGVAGGVQGSSIGAGLYRRLAREQTSFESLAGFADSDSVGVATAAAPAAQVALQYVSSNFFQTLGVPLILGRGFRDEEDRVGAGPVAVVSHRFWVARLGGESDVLDRVIRVNNVPIRIVGVAPAGFYGMQAGQWVDIYTPFAVREAFRTALLEGSPSGENGRDWWVRPLGRLKAGVSESDARVRIAQLFHSIAGPNAPEMILLPGRRGVGELNNSEKGALGILMSLVALLLFIVCANVANLLLSRAVGRHRESAVRLALGAARSRLFRQHFIESGILALAGGAAGLVLGYVLARGIHILFESGRDASSAYDLHIDFRVLGYACALSVLTALLFGLAPALRSARVDLHDVLKAQARSVMGARLRLTRLLVSVQIALCLTALVAAGLLGRSLENLKWVNVGFDRQNLAYASVNPWQAGYTKDRAKLYAERLREELQRLPGVLSVSPVNVRLLSGNGNISVVHVPGRPDGRKKGEFGGPDLAFRNSVGTEFFETLRIPLAAGRTFEPADLHANFDGVVVDQRFAKQFFPNQNPVGKRFGVDPRANTRFVILGVVGDSRYNSLRENGRPTIFEPYIAPSEPRPVHFAIRTVMDSALLARAVRKAVAAVDPAVPLSEFHTQTALIDRLLRTERLLSFVSAAFGLVALTLAAIGLGALLAYAVARRTNEIGVRIALGAAAGDVIGMVLRDSVWLVGGGILLGLPCAYVLGRFLKAALFRLEPIDPQTAVLACATLLAVAIFAAWIPARRAARIDPVSALRED